MFLKFSKLSTLVAALATPIFVSVAVAETPAWQTTTIKGVVFVTPKSADHSGKIDFAELERRYPATKDALKSWTQADLAKLNQEQLDQLYARLTAGPIPNGPYKGDIVFKNEGGLAGMAKKFFPLNSVVNSAFQILDRTGESLWKGKNFYRNEGWLRNLIEQGTYQRETLRLIAYFVLGTSPDFTKFRQYPKDKPKHWELFPAKLFCGQSLLDSRRESVIIDYAYSDNDPEYQKDIDFLATREGLAVRDEIRMVHPGLYLGRAYMRQMFGLIFTLSNEGAEKAGETNESCWTGTQPR